MPNPSANYYNVINKLSTNTYWVFAIVVQRNSSFEWEALPLSQTLNHLGYLTEQELPFDVDTVEEALLTLVRCRLLKNYEKNYHYYSPSATQNQLATRVMRQHLLLHFPTELAECQRGVLTAFQHHSRVFRRHHGNLKTLDKSFLSLFKSPEQKVRRHLDKLFPIQASPRSKYELEKTCSVTSSSQDQLEISAIYLPPYPPDFLDQIPGEFQRGIVKGFLDRPQLFPPDTHADLWRLAAPISKEEPNLVEQAAVHYLPGPPPGMESLPPALAASDLRIISGWVNGETRPENDDLPLSLSAPIASFPWLLRALRKFNRKQLTTTQLKQAADKATVFSKAVIERTTNPDSFSIEDLYTATLIDRIPQLALFLLISVWTKEESEFNKEIEELDVLRHTIDGPHLAEMPWLRGQIANSLGQLIRTNKADHWRELAEQLKAQHGFRYLDELISPPQPWERLLLTLEKDSVNTGSKQQGDQKLGDRRLAYFYDSKRGKLSCKEQTYGKRGWSPGRKIAWRDFQNAKLHERDAKLGGSLRNYRGGPINLAGNPYSWENQIYSIEVKQALYLLADHPHVFEDNEKRSPLVIEKDEAQLLVEHDEAENLNVRFEPTGLDPGYNVKRTAPGRLTVYHLTDELYDISRRIPRGGINVPAFAAERLDRVLPGLKSKMTVHSSTDWRNEGLEEIAGLPFPCFHLFPLGAGAHRVEVYIKPVPEAPYYHRPGEGLSRSLIATEETGRAVLSRDLDAEQKAVAKCLKSIPVPAEREWAGYDLLLEEDQETLEVVMALHELNKQGVAVMEYPKGQRLKLNKTMDDEQLKVAVSSGRDWFRVDAGLQVDEDRVIDYELILEGLRNADRFIKVGEDEYLTITDKLRQRLQQMDGLLHKNRGRQEIPALAGEAFAEVLEGIEGLEFDAEWAANLQRIAAAKTYVPPPVPTNFKAELRPYQLVGYEWLLKMANWGVGACLADDMGLGKTIQALAVLTERAGGGPALVIAPASVIRNWRSETEKFAPALKTKLIESANSATAILNSLEAGDLALLSFGLLPYIAEELLTYPFHTLVVDEAQAIKNAATQRARAVRDLQADFKMATTGTPIENNLAELWSLFRFLNPGLFGSYQRFRKQYETPIVKHEDKTRAEQLRKIVRPFILRRRKDEVLKELPPKTEIVRTVEPGPEERSLYEALRRKALRDIEAADAIQRRFLVLQQLTKLRQAACHPKLVRKGSKIPSAKLAAVEETIEEIISGGHKALIFSQFVRHLKLVEELVKSKGIEYQYLDGSTPGKTRQRRVEAFQAGEGDVFLISLKAGGTGLNLTAADYVLHLDPWWNPAAEDQASDRAHRIGQKRAVTVYRFVSSGTIEEQIIELHAAKRDLADQLLTGTEGTSQLSVDEVVDLLRSGDS